MYLPRDLGKTIKSSNLKKNTDTYQFFSQSYQRLCKNANLWRRRSKKYTLITIKAVKKMKRSHGDSLTMLIQGLSIRAHFILSITWEKCNICCTPFSNSSPVCRINVKMYRRSFYWYFDFNCKTENLFIICRRKKLNIKCSEIPLKIILSVRPTYTSSDPEQLSL